MNELWIKCDRYINKYLKLTECITEERRTLAFYAQIIEKQSSSTELVASIRNGASMASQIHNILRLERIFIYPV